MLQKENLLIFIAESFVTKSCVEFPKSKTQSQKVYQEAAKGFPKFKLEYDVLLTYIKSTSLKGHF